MKKTLFSVVLILLAVFSALAQEQPTFDAFFVDETMRIDYYHVGDSKVEFIALDKIYRQGTWAGPVTSLLDNFNNGRYYVKIYDSATGRLIYSRGFDNYFGEYKTTNPAAEGIKRAYHESALIPYPRSKILFTMEVRQRDNTMNRFFSQEIDPASIEIDKGPLVTGVEVEKKFFSGNPHHKVDVAFIAEGYTVEEKALFHSDLDKVLHAFFNQEPYKSYKDSFNIYSLFISSQDSGVDEPRNGLFRNTPVESSFNALGLSRYLLTEGNKSLRNIAAHAPYDAVVIVVNSKRYGGGGIYNFYCVYTQDEIWQDYLFLHEFGHSFAGLGDEYYASAVAYNDFYPKGIEPTEPNITSLLDPQNLKWKGLLKPGTPVPTPWDKELYDKMKDNSAEKQAHLEQIKFKGLIGAFEGAGYASKGLYRPMADCIMFTKGNKPYCKVCEAHIVKVIEHYTKSE